MTFMLGSNSGRKREEEKGGRERGKRHTCVQRERKRGPLPFLFPPLWQELKKKKGTRIFFLCRLLINVHALVLVTNWGILTNEMAYKMGAQRFFLLPLWLVGCGVRHAIRPFGRKKRKRMRNHFSSIPPPFIICIMSVVHELL